MADQLSTAVATATTMVRARLDCDDIDVVFYAEPDDTIPEWGIGGYTQGKHLVLVAIHPTRKIDDKHLLSTLIHEFHHALRWRHTTLGEDLGDMLVSEGLAVLFESEILEEPIYAKVKRTQTNIRLALDNVSERPCNTGRWLYGAGDLPKAFGYSLGYRLCRDYALKQSRSAAELSPWAVQLQCVEERVGGVQGRRAVPEPNRQSSRPPSAPVSDPRAGAVHTGGDPTLREQLPSARGPHLPAHEPLLAAAVVRDRDLRRPRPRPRRCLRLVGAPTPAVTARPAARPG